MVTQKCRDIVSLVINYTSYCPYINKDDHITVHTDFVLRGTSFVDEPLGANHTVNADTAKLLRALGEGLRYDQLLAIAKRLGADSSNVVNLLGFLNAAGALQYRRSPYGHAKALLNRTAHSLLGIHYGSIARRWPHTNLGILAATMHASSLVLWSSTFVAIFIAGTGLHSLHSTLLVLIYGNFLFLISLIAHEYGHWTELRKYGLSFVITSGPLRLGIIHKTIARDQEITVAIRGPLYGCLVACAGIAAALLVAKPVLALISCVICCIHFGSLLPWYGDGKTIHKSLKGTS